jgi:aminoglycoside phosphotransferase (APT) family kinase protein
MSELRHDLPPGIVEWIADTGRGELTRLERHVARREAWIVDVTRPDGSVLEGFLRLEREPAAGDPWSLRKETRIVEALGRTSVPVPKVLGASDALHCTLFERARGRSDLDKLADARRQRAVMEDFIRVLARLHTLDPGALGIAGEMPQHPATAEQAALGEVELVLARWKRFLRSYAEPLLRYGVDWLRRFAPKRIARVSLVQGDTGPVNFLFEGDRVSAVIDWEWGHLGDPLEDLGNLCVREFWNPSGGLAGLFRLYERESGIPYSREAALYYRVQQNVRGMVGIHAVTALLRPREPVSWFLAYRYVGDRATCEALAEAMGVAVERPELPRDDGAGDVLAEAARFALAHDVEPALASPFARSRAAEARILVEVIERRRRFGPALAAAERDELGALLGRRPRNLAEGRRALDRAVRERALGDEAVVRYLTRRAYRDEWLHAPAAALYPNRRWSEID